MKRFHVNVTVTDLARSVTFYSELFGSPPTTQKSDYAKWMLDDPHVNFAITTRGEKPGIDHLGLQAQDEQEFTDVRRRLDRAEAPILDQAQVTCCYAKSTKAWVRDPAGIAWETFLTRGESTVFGDGGENTVASLAGAGQSDAGCCGDLTAQDTENEGCCRPEV